MTTVLEDEYGQYKPDAGNDEPIDADDVNYDPCNAVLNHTFERYGERRYCGALAVSNFGDEANYEDNEYCKWHQDGGFEIDD